MPECEVDFSTDELMVVCISRQIQDGEIVAQGLATPLVTAAYLLARRTHAPNLYFTSAISQGICRHPAPLGLTNVESSVVGLFAQNGWLRACCRRYAAATSSKGIF